MSRLLYHLSYPADSRSVSRAPKRNRTVDLLLTMETLCRLSYGGAVPASTAAGVYVRRGSPTKSLFGRSNGVAGYRGQPRPEDRMQPVDLVIAVLLMLGAILYTSVGHAGSSIYIAVMSLFGVPATVIKPTALSLNILVSAYTSRRFIARNYFDRRLIVPLLCGAIPLAFLGGRLQLPAETFRVVVGIILVVAGMQFAFRPRVVDDRETAHPPWWVSIAVGGAIGFVSGITGTGGGIFLTPLMLIFGWTAVRSASGTAAVFIFANSLSGLLGNLSSVRELPPQLPLYVVAVMLGAVIGTRLGISVLSTVGIKRAVGAVLVIAGLKLALNL